MSYLSARRSPWPYHFKIGNVGLMLGAPTAPTRANPTPAQLVSSKSADISQVAPPDYSYGGMSPASDREEPYESLVPGMGMKIQEKWQDGRYFDAQAVDCSVWPWCKGPELTAFTPSTHDAAPTVATYFELGTTLYLAQGRYVLQRTNDSTWTQVYDAGAGNQILSATVFTSNYDGVQRVFLARQTGVAVYSSNGTVWTAMATFSALALCAIGREFWWADDTNRLRKCDTNADPTNEANYTSLIFRAGDKLAVITSLVVTAAGTLLILKTDGIYTLDGAGDDHQLFPFLRFARDSNNGRWYGQYENSLYVTYGNQLLRIDTDLSMTEVGVEKLANYDGPVRGRVTAFAAVGTMFAYAAVFNPDSLTGYLLKFGAWVTQGVPNASLGSAPSVHVDAWHGSVTAPFSSRSVQALFVSAIGGPTGHTRTYLAFSDGTLGWMVNPCVPNPAACSAYRFSTGDGYVNLPLWHGGYHASKKSIRHATATGQLDASDYLTLDYKLDPAAGSWTTLAGRFDTGVLEQISFPTTAVAVLAAFRIHLVNSVNTASPLVSAFSIGHALRPMRYMTLQVNVLCADGLVRRDGVPLRIGRKEIKRIVEAAVDTPGAVTCTLPDETVEDLSFTDYSVSQSFDEVGRQWRGSLAIKAVQWISDTPP